ncbi:MAG: tetratricopeptide repeat protein [Crocinitomicaceae bacterium]|nr:tetratricopeptide repeat protein [Crocinitomicaceae bacterium]
MKYLLFLLFTISCYTGVTQNKIDSLWQVWESNAPDSVRIKALSNYAWKKYMFSQPDSAFVLNKMGLDLALEKGLLKSQMLTYNAMGISHDIRSNMDSALFYYKKVIQVGLPTGMLKGISGTVNNMGNLYKTKGDFAKAVEYYTYSLKLDEKDSNYVGMGHSLNNIGTIYLNQGDFEEARGYFLRSQSRYKLANNEKGVGIIYNNIGLSYKEQAVVEKKQCNDSLAHELFSFGLEYFMKSISIKEALNDVIGKAQSMNNIGTIYIHQEKFQLADSTLQATLEIQRSIGNSAMIVSTLYNLGDLYYRMGRISQAEKYYEESHQISEDLGLKKGIMNGAYGLYVVNKDFGNYERALTYFEQHIEKRDTIQSVESKKDILRHEFQYEYDKQHLADSLRFIKEAEMAEIQHQNEIKKEEERRYVLYGGILVLLILGGVIYRGYRRKKRDNELISEQKLKVEQQKSLIEQAHEEIKDSITYAKRIQTAILPPSDLIKKNLNEVFVLYKPKDIVAGDFYWMESTDDAVLFAAADCTGHGVPGAMVSVVCNNALNRSVREFGLMDPGQILNKTREIVIKEFEKSKEEVKDGMDIALCALHSPTSSRSVLKYAGANNPLWIVRKGSTEIEEIKGNKQPIGAFERSTPFESHEVELKKGDSIYIFSDGFADQFGGDKGKKFKSKNLNKLILSVQHQSLDQQRERFDEEFERWKGNLEQIDDICVIGVRI